MILTTYLLTNTLHGNYLVFGIAQQIASESKRGLKKGLKMAADEKMQGPAKPEPDVLADSQSIRREIDDLRSRIDAESKGLLAWAKKWLIWLSLITAVFALPRGGLDLYHLIRNRPDSNLVPGNTLSMAYDPSKSRLEFTFGFAANNVGSEDDLLNLGGHLAEQANAQNDLWPFSAADLSCTSQGSKLPIPFAVRTSVPISVECTISVKFDPSKSSLLLRQGDYRLKLDFSGPHNRTQSMNFCFHLTKSMIDEVFKSSHQEQRRFIYPICEQQP